MAHVPESYKGKNPMTRTKWRHHQRNKKAQKEASSVKTPTHLPARKGVKKMANKGPLLEIPLCTTTPEGEEPTLPTPFLDAKRKGEKLSSSLDDEMVKSNFDDDLDILLDFNIVSMLPMEFDKISKVSENDEDVLDNVADQKPLCYTSWIMVWLKRGHRCFKNLT